MKQSELNLQIGGLRFNDAEQNANVAMTELL